MTAQSDWLRPQIAPALSSVFLLVHAVESGGFDPHALRREIDGAIAKIRLDEPARALGFTPDLITAVKLALVTAADEVTQRPSSRCDYSAPPPAGELPLLQQKYFNNRIDLGHRFFDELKTLVDPHIPSPPALAVLEVFALAMALGVRGKYTAFGLEGYDAHRTRLFAKLRANLALPEGPPAAPPAPWPAAPRTSRLLAWATGLTVLFAAALLLTYHIKLRGEADALRDALTRTLTPARP